MHVVHTMTIWISSLVASPTPPCSTPPPTQREEAWILLAGSSHLLTQDPTLSHGLYRLIMMLEHPAYTHLQHNGENIDESRHVSYYNGPSGDVWDQGGRTMVLHLDQGDTLQLYCDDCTAKIGDITFCVSLTTFDII